MMHSYLQTRKGEDYEQRLWDDNIPAFADLVLVEADAMSTATPHVMMIMMKTS
jgi:hypothetical protein